jgi:hypothetical protein
MFSLARAKRTCEFATLNVRQLITYFPFGLQNYLIKGLLQRFLRVVTVDSESYMEKDWGDLHHFLLLLNINHIFVLSKIYATSEIT